jgi:hypothetical protein
MRTYEVTRTLVKSPPELWAELESGCLESAVGEVQVEPMQAERALRWKAEGASGGALLEPSSWGTKVTLTAEVEEQVAQRGIWSRFRSERAERAKHEDIEQKLETVLDDLGSAHKKPFAKE